MTLQPMEHHIVEPGLTSLRNATQDTSLCDSVLLANTPFKRLRGLLGRPQLKPGAGLLLMPSDGIHTFGMRYAIDTVSLDDHFRVVRVCEHVVPWRIRLGCRNTCSVLELRAGEVSRTGLAVGDQLQFALQGIEVTDSLAACEPSRAAGSSLRAAIKLLLALLLCVQLVLCWGARERSLNGQVDLRAYYAAGAAVRHGDAARIYDDAAEQTVQQALFHDHGRTLHFLYPPFAVLPYVPLSLLPYRLAFAVVLLTNLCCLWAAAWLLVREHPAWKLSVNLLFVAFLACLPTAIALMQGQISCVLLLIVTLVYCLQRRNKSLQAGLCLAAGLANFQVVLPVVLLFLLWRQFRLVTGFAVGTIAVAMLSLLLAGPAGLQAYAHRLHSLGASTLLDTHAAHVRYGMEIAAEPNLHGLATVLAGSGTAGALLTAALSLAVLLWAARQRPSVVTAVSAALLLSFHLQPYGLVILLLPLTVQAMEGLTLPAAPRHRIARWLLVCSMGVLCALVAPYLMLHHATLCYVLASLGSLAAPSLLSPPTAANAADTPHSVTCLVGATSAVSLPG